MTIKSSVLMRITTPLIIETDDVSKKLSADLHTYIVLRAGRPRANIRYPYPGRSSRVPSPLSVSSSVLHPQSSVGKTCSFGHLHRHPDRHPVFEPRGHRCHHVSVSERLPFGSLFRSAVHHRRCFCVQVCGLVPCLCYDLVVPWHYVFSEMVRRRRHRHLACSEEVVAAFVPSVSGRRVESCAVEASFGGRGSHRARCICQTHYLLQLRRHHILVPVGRAPGSVGTRGLGRPRTCPVLGRPVPLCVRSGAGQRSSPGVSARRYVVVTCAAVVTCDVVGSGSEPPLVDPLCRTRKTSRHNARQRDSVC